MNNRIGSLLQGAALAAVFAAGGACTAQNSGFNLDMHANSNVTSKDIGLPLYPGATPWKEKDGDWLPTSVSG